MTSPAAPHPTRRAANRRTPRLFLNITCSAVERSPVASRVGRECDGDVDSRMRPGEVRRADAHRPARPDAAYFVRQRGRLSPAFFVQVSFVPLGDLAVLPAGEQYSPAPASASGRVPRRAV